MRLPLTGPRRRARLAVVVTSVEPGNNGVLFCSQMNTVSLWLIMTQEYVFGGDRERDLFKHVFVSVIVLVGDR